MQREVVQKPLRRGSMGTLVALERSECYEFEKQQGSECARVAGGGHVHKADTLQVSRDLEALRICVC